MPQLLLRFRQMPSHKNKAIDFRRSGKAAPLKADPVAYSNAKHSKPAYVLGKNAKPEFTQHLTYRLRWSVCICQRYRNEAQDARMPGESSTQLPVPMADFSRRHRYPASKSSHFPA
jgi:hypothetical protein